MSASLISQREKQPVLVLTCLKDSHPFQDRTIILNELVKVGRSVARAKPSPTNSIFDCKVLSRSHALIWYKQGRFWLRDTNSSNGTFVNSTKIVKKNDEECADREIFSGDIIRFGVDVVEHDTTHGCIIAQVKLYHPNGQEAKPIVESVNDNGICGIGTFHAEQVFLLTHYINEALFREQLLDTKVESVRKLLQETQDVSKTCWQAMLNEEQLLDKLNLYESQLSVLKQDLPEKSLQSQIAQALEEKYNLEKASKIMLERLLNDKTAVSTKAADLELALTDSETECARLRQDYEETQKAYQTMLNDRQDKLVLLEQLQQRLKEVDLAKSIANENIKQQASRIANTDAKPDTAPLVNGLDGVISEHFTGISEPHIDEDGCNDDMVLAELSEFDRFCDQAQMNADGSSNKSSRLGDSIRSFNQSVQMLKSIESELNKLSRICENSNEIDYTDPDQYGPNCSLSNTHEASPKYKTNDFTLSKHGDFAGVLTHVNEQITCLINYQTQAEMNLKTISDELARTEQKSVLCNTSGDAFTERFNNVSQDVVKQEEADSSFMSSTGNPVCIDEITQNNNIDANSTDLKSDDQDEMTSLQNELRRSLNESETYKKLNETLRQQDAAKAALLLSVREECDELKHRITLIEADVATGRADHQRLVMEARKARSEVEELQKDRDNLSTQLTQANRQLETFKSALTTTLLGEDKSENSPKLSVTNINGGDSVQELSSQQVQTQLSSAVTTTSNEVPRIFLLNEHSFSMFVVIPIMVILCAFMAYIFLKFAR